jgi:hypothetical protein
MQSKSLAEVKGLVGSAEFQAWADSLAQTVAAAAVSGDRFEELLTQSTLLDFRAELAQKNAIDTLYKAGDCEDVAARLNAEATDIENRSFEVIATFEEQRLKVSEIWYRMGAVEKGVNELRERVQNLRNEKHEAEAADLEATLRKQEREHRQVHGDYERETQRKTRLWEEVERMWGESAELNLLMAEKRLQGRKIRVRAERLFREAEERKGAAKKLRGEADQESATRASHQKRAEELLRDARERFGCAAGEEFLYWRQREDKDGAYCVPLISDTEGYNLEVRRLGIYRLQQKRGLDFLEPALEGLKTPSEGRVDDFLQSGRRGLRRSDRT